MPTKKKSTPKVLMAMSGGVDSSVAAALLVKQGYEVVGAFMKQWSDTKEVSGLCSWVQDRRDALRIAAHLGIPLMTLDFEQAYREHVLAYMFREYEAGRTPNPDVLCNKWVKFGFWLEKAREMGFEYLATGHYARIEEQGAGNKERKQLLLIEAKDTNKDQTYFLHQLGQEQLRHTLFPIGGYTKAEVRQLARTFKLPTAERAESMGICFVGEIPMKEFLQQKIKSKPGKVVLSSGEIVGEHEGLAFYTVGQRHLGGSFKFKVSSLKDGDTRPLFVVEKRVGENELVVGFEDDRLLYRKHAEVEEVHWVSGQEPVFPLKCLVRLRHRQELQKCVVKEITKQRNNEILVVEFEKAQRAVTPGQFAVFYKGGVCLGGGVIY